MKKNISILLLCFAFATVSGQAPYPFVKYSMVPSGIQTNDYHLKVFVDIWNGTSAASFSGAVKPVSVYASHVTYQLTWNTSTVNFGTVLISRDNFHTLGAGWEYHQVRVSEVPGLLQSGLICEFHPGFKIGANYCYNGGSINQYGNWVNHGINASGNPVALVPRTILWL